MRRAILPLVVALLTLPIGPADAQPRVDKNVVYGMVSGTALLLDVHHPTAPNGAGAIWVGGKRQPIRLGALVLRAAPTNLSTVRESDGLARLGAFLQMSAPTGHTPCPIRNR